MAVHRMLCGIAALSLSAAVLMQVPSAQARKGCRSARHLGPVTAVGCWHASGPRWRAAMPVTLNGMTLKGGGAIVLDPRGKTISTTRPVRWLFGRVQFRRAAFTWKADQQLRFDAVGAVRALGFRGGATLAFTRTKGGTARLTTRVTVPVAGGLSGDAVLKVSRNGGFDVRKVHVGVGELPLGRLVFNQLDFSYSGTAWSARAAVRLPAFTGSNVTIAGHLTIANGKLRDVGVSGSGLKIPLGDGFFLTRAGFDLGLDPLVIQGSASATYGPPIAGGGPLLLVGKLQYSSEPERWDATGTVSLPWGIPGVTPTAKVGLGVFPGRAMSFTGDLDLSVHGWGVTGHLDGFASPKAFNAEGTGSLKTPLGSLSGNALVSSKGMAACGKLKLLHLGKKGGFGYTWGGRLDILGSSCDIGRYRVLRGTRGLTRIAQPQTVDVTSRSGFAIFAAQGGDFRVSGPTGTFDSTPDRDTPDSFAVHDTTDGWAYLAIPVFQPDDPAHPDATYTVTPLGTGELTSVVVAGGLQTLAESGLVSGGVSGSGSVRTLDYTIDPTALDPGETVSFYQGSSVDPGGLAGAAPIAEDVTASNTATFTPEPLGLPTRGVFAVVSIDGRPREQFQIATFDAAPVALPIAYATIQPSTGGWTAFVNPKRSLRAAGFQVLTTADDGRREWQDLPGTGGNLTIPSLTATHATVEITPLDQWGRAGPAVLCDSAKPGVCPPA